MAEYKDGKYVGRPPKRTPTMDELADKTHPPPNLAQRAVGAAQRVHPFGRAMSDVTKGLAPQKKK
jgi:hypothetical protein